THARSSSTCDPPIAVCEASGQCLGADACWRAEKARVTEPRGPSRARKKRARVPTENTEQKRSSPRRVRLPVRPHGPGWGRGARTDGDADAPPTPRTSEYRTSKYMATISHHARRSCVIAGHACDFWPVHAQKTPAEHSRSDRGTTPAAQKRSVRQIDLTGDVGIDRLGDRGEDVIGHNGVDGQRDECLTTLLVPNHLHTGDVDIGITQQRADTADDAGTILIGQE